MMIVDLKSSLKPLLLSLRGDEATLKTLLDSRQIDVNEKDYAGWTPLVSLKSVVCVCVRCVNVISLFLLSHALSLFDNKNPWF